VRRRPLGRVVAAAALAAAAAACGGGDDADGPTGDASDVDEAGFGIRTWSAAEIGAEPGTVVLTVLAPVGEGCEEPMTADVIEMSGRPDSWHITVKVPPGLPPEGCALGERTVEAELPDGTNDRDLVVGGGSRRFGATGDGYELDVSTTPCGRADCSGVAPVLAPCDEAGVAAALDTLGDEIDPGGTPGACDGSFLWVGFTTGGGGCPPTEGVGENPCAHDHGAWFIARDGQWSILAWDTPDCDELELYTLVRATDAVCADPFAGPATTTTTAPR
jgi:hypothetical protein